MKKKLLLHKVLCCLVFFCLYGTSFGQLLINSSLTPQQLVQDVLVGGGVTVSSVTYTGAATAIGSFTNGNTTNLGIDAGIVLCSGNITQIPSTLGSAGDVSTNLSLNGDAALDNLTSNTTYDASVLEFNFIPINDTLQFRYVFASEEYPEYVCSSYNDVFGFFVTGPNPAGGNYTNQNVALIPGSSLAVAINSVNSGSPGGSYSSGGCSSLAYSSLYVNNTGNKIAFDGFTVVLTAMFRVTPCVSYHIKLAVADAGDHILDSGVFLEANSFSATGFSVSSSYSNTSLGNNAIEGCSNGIFAFTTNTVQTSPLTINYTVGGSAANGIDYASIGNSVVIPAGSDSVAIVISPFMDGLTEGNETVTLSVTNVCTTEVFTINIIDNVDLALTPSGGTSICPGGSATLSVTATGGITPYTYAWSNGGGSGTSATFSPSTNTTYTVTVTDRCGQTETASQTINVNSSVALTITPANPTICPGDPVTLTASGASTYTWAPSTGLSSTSGTSVTASPITTTTYTVTGTSAGCSGTGSVTVNVSNNLSVSVSPTSANICPGDPVTLTASGSATSYSWSPSTGLSTITGATVVASPTTSTTYTVTGSSGGCTGSASVNVNVSNNMTVSITPLNPTICLGSSVSLTANGTASSYTWSPSTGLSSTSGATVTASPTTMTTYTVTAATGGCTASASVTVNIAPGLNIAVTPNSPSICPGANVSLTASGGNSYTWSPATGLSSTSGTSVTANPTTTTTYSVTGTDAAGCSGTTTVTVNVDPISASAISTNENCGQANGTATVTPSGNCPAGFTYKWSTLPIQTNATATNLSAGSYTVSVYCGLCLTTASANVTNLPGPSVAIIAFTNTTCGYANGSATAQATGGGGGYSYSWSNGQSGPSISNVPAGTYQVTVFDQDNCSAQNSVTISDSPGPSAMVTGLDNASCGLSDGSASVTASGGMAGYTYSWSNGSSSSSISGVPTGTYTVTVTDANSCSTSTMANVGEDPGPGVSALSENEICDQANGSAWATATGGTGTYTYLWSNGNTTANATGLVAGTYSVTISDGGCSAATTVSVLETPGPDAGFSANPSVLTMMDGPVTFLDNSSGNIVNWVWNFGDGSANSGGNNPTHPYDNLGTFVVTLIVTDNNGCMDTTQDTIKIKEIFTFYIPSSFTPNNDGINDIWFPKGLSVDPDDYEIYIFDRWGNLMFYSTEWNTTLNQGGEGWIGTKDNSGSWQDVVMDTYVYRIKCKEIDGPKHEYIGKIALIP